MEEQAQQPEQREEAPSAQPEEATAPSQVEAAEPAAQAEVEAEAAEPAEGVAEQQEAQEEKAAAEPTEMEAEKPAEELPCEEKAAEAAAEPMEMEAEKPAEDETPAQPMQVEADTATEEKPAQTDKPQALKKPKTAFWIYQEEVREQVAQEIGSKQGAKVVAAMAAKWKALDEPSRAVYTDRAKKLMEQYQKDIANGAAPAPAAKKAPAKGKKAVKGKKSKASKMARALLRRAAPKKPKGSYSIWLTENRHKVIEKLKAEGSANPTFEEIARAAGKAWGALPAEEKAPFSERSRALGDKYKEINIACKEYKKANLKDLKGKAKAKAAKAAAKAAKVKAAKAAKVAAKKAAKSPEPTKKQQAAAAKKEEAAKKKEAKKQETPKKRAADASPLPTPTKKAAKKTVGASKVAAVYLDTVLETEAEKIGMAGSFRRLAERDDMKKFAQRVLLDALKANEGLMHKAKDAVLAGGA